MAHKKYKYIYWATANRNPKGWRVSFKGPIKVRDSYQEIKRVEDNLWHTEKWIIHSWVYDERFGKGEIPDWRPGFLTERQLEAHFGIKLPPRFLRGESSPKMTDYLNDRGSDE